MKILYQLYPRMLTNAMANACGCVADSQLAWLADWPLASADVAV